MFVYFDAQLYANELAAARGEEHNNMLKQQRRNKGHGKLTVELLAELQPRNWAEVHDEILGMGGTHRTDINSEQVYRIYKQRQNIEQFFRTYDMSLNFDASYMRSQTSQEAWFFLYHLSAATRMDALR